MSTPKRSRVEAGDWWWSYIGGFVKALKKILEVLFGTLVISPEKDARS